MASHWQLQTWQHRLDSGAGRIDQQSEDMGNITLPLWYHHRPQNLATEETVARWLAELKLDKLEWEKFMASPAARLKPWERKLAGCCVPGASSPTAAG